MTKAEIDNFLKSAYSKAEYELMFQKARNEELIFNLIWEMVMERADNQSWRLLWILDHATEKSNRFIFPILDKLYQQLLITNNESFIREGMKLILRCPINEEYAGKLLKRCIGWMNDRKKKMSSQTMGLEFFYRICLLYPEMIPELLAHIDNISEWATSAGYLHRLKIIRNQLEKKPARN